ncbi:unnamed protein product [Mytilus coruscus]|uniref:Endonuclease/exonuclease/phosphatase domain-containing protein n=1 Tax=Mytilus coruscus TaxID=42192 RepID=A0A6J8ALX5_MYTCO|nr:unnamed protein product [Mytilus coruscus]
MNRQIVLIGDLNARTGQRADYIVNDSDHINNFDGFDLLPENYITDSEIKRNNQDTSVNIVGTKLLDLCLSSRLRLLNGRFLGDSLGYYTYTSMSNSGFSTVDYAVVSESLLSSVKYFKTNDFTYLSDHVQITLYMKCSINIDKEIGLEEKGWHWIKSYKWTENSKLKLIDALLTENVKNEIIEFEMINYEENQVGVDEATEKLTKILDNISSLSCKATPKTKRRKKKKKLKQVWSDNVIYETKRQINKIGNKIRNNPNNNSLKQKRKCEYINQNPKEYWNILKSLKNKTEKDEIPEVLKDEEVLIKHFQDQGKPSSINNAFMIDIESQLKLLENNIDFKAETDSPISCSEVKKVISGLKLQKSAGPDRIINEIIKTSNQVIIKSIVKIFNLILKKDGFILDQDAANVRRRRRIFNIRTTLSSFDHFENEMDITSIYRLDSHIINEITLAIEPDIKHDTNRSHALTPETQVLLALRFSLVLR